MAEIALLHALRPDVSVASGARWINSASRDVNDAVRHQVLRFPNTASTRMPSGCVRRIPQGYTQRSLEVKGVVTVDSAAAGNIVLDLDVYRGRPGTDSIDPSAATEALTITIAAPGTARGLVAFTFTLTAANFQVGDLILIKLSRDKSDAADTAADDVDVEDVTLVLD